MINYLMMNRKILISVSFLMLMLGVITSTAARDLTKVNISSDNILLLEASLDKKPLIAALDTYIVNDKLMLAVDPLFDSLALRYIREKELLRIWKDEEIIDHKLSNKGSSGYWADDGFFLYLDQHTFSQLFDVTISYNTSSLKLDIKTNSFNFPKQKLETLAYQRQMAQLSTGVSTKTIDGTNLLRDQYRLFTLPHGSFSLNTSVDNNKNNPLNYSVQTVSDFLYHSASLTLTDFKAGDATGRLNFSRYKSLPDDLIGGMFDSYSFGDINSISDNLTNSTQSGLGFTFTRAPEQYRTRNVGTTITEVARPGWDAELYRNGQFIELKKVPLDGNLVFEDVETQYGSNRYKIKLYGPFGEEEVRHQSLTLDKNALSEGELAYSFYGLDDSMRLINNQSQDSLALNNAGASVSYGITDNWLVGFNYSSRKNNLDETEQSLTLKNSLAFPGLLFNNEISVQENRGYAQISSLSGNAFGQDTFNLTFESSDDYQSNRVNSGGIERQYVDLSYSGNFNPLHYSLGLSYLNRDDNESWQARNTVSRNIAGINFSNNLSYRQDAFDNYTSTAWNGTFVAAGSLTQAIRMSAAVNYRPDQDDVIQNTSATLSWNDSFNLYHNLRATYNLQRPTNKWQLNYNLSWNSDKFQLQLATNYDAESNWSVGLGVRFFLGYDHHNQKVIFSNQLSSNSATLNTYSYLDRNPNGWRDEADWDLEGVKFTGIPAWDDLASGKTGRAILPGVNTKVPFKFNAQWEYGTKAVANNFLIYTHPGAYIDVNMPFYVTTDFSGFIYKVNYYKEQSPLTGVLIELFNNKGNVISVTSSDVDGYYQFSNLTPGNYQVRIAPEYLNQSGYTSNTIGYQFSTPSAGGIISLPTMTIKKRPTSQKKGTESIKSIDVNMLDNEANVWLDSDDQNYGKVYSLASSGGYSTQQKPFEPDTLPNTPVTRNVMPVQPVNREQLPTQSTFRPSLLPTPITRTQLPVQPITRNRLPMQPAVRDALPVELNTNEQTSNSELTEQVPVINQTTEAEVLPVDIEEQAKALPLPLPLEEGVRFTLQLGAFSTKAAATAMLSKLETPSSAVFIYEDNSQNKSLFRVFIGKFSSHQQAVSYRKNNLAQTNNSFVRPIPKQKADQFKNKSALPQGYVIQFIAGKDRLKILASAASIPSVNEVFVAEKQINGDVWYCLISQTFINKSNAQRSLNASGLSSAWLENKAKFTNIIALDN